jgi:hypothetical protein
MTHKHPKILLAGLYIGILTFGLYLIILWLLDSIRFLQSLGFLAIMLLTIVFSVTGAYWIEETIRTSGYSRRNKIILACALAAIVVVLGAGLWIYWDYKVAQSLNGMR